MKMSSVATFLLSHFVAACISFAVFVIVPIVFVVACMIIGNDPGGPIFLPIFVLMCLFFAACACGGLFGVCGVLQLLRRFVGFSWWVPVVLVFPVCFGVLLVARVGGRTEPMAGLIIASLIVSSAFAVYWLTLSASSGIMNWIRIKLKRATGS